MNQEGTFIASMICASPRAYAKRIVERQLELQPGAEGEYGRGWSDLVPDTEVRLGYLAEALATDRPALLDAQLAWVKVICASRGVSSDLLRVNLECTREELLERLPPDCSERVDRVLTGAIERFAAAPSEVESLLGAWTPSRIPEEAKAALRERMGAAAREAGLDALPPVEA